MVQDWQSELGFDFLEFGEEKLSAGDFIAVFEAEEIGLAGSCRGAGDFVDEIAR